MSPDASGTDEVSDETTKFEEKEAGSGHGADREPTEDEADAAESARKDPDIAGDPSNVADNYREMARRGVDEKGEGRID